MMSEGSGPASDDPLADLRADLAHRGELTPAALADRLQADQARRWHRRPRPTASCCRNPAALPG